jgi:hypothetical protein
VHRLIPHSLFLDPPWSDDEWNCRLIGVQAGTGNGLFTSWPSLAPIILDFIKS